MQVVVQIDRLQVLNIDISDRILAQIPHLVERVEHCVVLLDPVDHLNGEVLALVDPIVAYVDGHDNEALVNRGVESAVSVDYPPDCHVGEALAVELASSDALTVLEYGGDLIFLDDFADQGAVGVARLDRLAELPATKDVAGGAEDAVEHHNLWCILKAPKREPTLNALRLVDVGQDEEVHEAFV